MKVTAIAALALLIFAGSAARAQVWIQIEAHGTRELAEEAAERYAARLENVSGYRQGPRWFAVVLGPYDERGARADLIRLRAANAIPRDSFLNDGGGFGPRFFEGAGEVALRPKTPEAPAATTRAAVETPRAARASERRLPRAERELVQTALKWEGHYEGAIDADFGSGTRRAMAAYQKVQGFEPTGVLTTRQRAALLRDYRAVKADLGLETITDPKAGVEVTLPLGRLAFEGYGAPFVRYPAEEGPAQVLLISQSGDQGTLWSLYDILQTLSIVPPGGRRERGDTRFVITGRDEGITTEARAELVDGAVKGWILVWPANEEKTRSLVSHQMAASFRSVEGVLPDEAGLDRAAQTPEIFAGVTIRKPYRARSGFFVDDAGAVATAAGTVDGCGRVTLGDDIPATIAASDPDLGVALLEPGQPVSPIDVAEFATTTSRLQSEIAVSGFSHGGALGAPTLSYGRVADIRGLSGEETLDRLAIKTLPGDEGGPVLGSDGAVAGLLLMPRDDDHALPDSVSLAADARALVAFLGEAGIEVMASDGGETITRAELARKAADITVLVSCWE